MFLLAYRSSKHEVTQVISAEFYFGRDLPLDLLRSSLSSSGYSENPDDYVRDLRKKLDKIHQDVRDRMEMKSNRVKRCYDRKARDCFFEQGQKRSGFIIFVEKNGKLNCREIGKVHMR